MRTSALAAPLLLLAAAAPAAAGPLQDAVGAPEGFTLKAGLRSRSEAIDNQFRPTGPESDALWSLRANIFAEYDFGAVRIGAQLIDTRAYFGKHNSTGWSTSEVNALELSQAYVGIDAKAAGGDLAVKAGRYVFSLGSKRLIDGEGARNTVNAFTGAIANWKGKGGDKITAFWSMPHIRLPEDVALIRDNAVEWDLETSDLQFWGAHLSHPLGKLGSVELYGLGLDERDSDSRQTSNRHLFTPGARAVRAPKAGQYDWDVEAAYQFGSIRATRSAADRRDLAVSAGFIHAEAGRTFEGGWAPRVSVHYDLATGDKRNTRTYNRFDTLYGSRRSDFGPVSLYGPVSRANLVSAGLRLDVAPSKRLDASLMVRELWLDSRTDAFASTGVRDARGLSGSHAGRQFEGRVRYWIIPEIIRADLGAAWLDKGRFLAEAPNARNTGDTRYAYLDLIFEF
ncbi:MAG TPA: alginate export family protein [Allosphingosinicella sp.]